MKGLPICMYSWLLLIVFSACPILAEPVVEVEEILTKYEPANNGAGPMWCFGSTCIARCGDDVYASTIETGKDVPPLCNCRWQLWHRLADGWKLIQSEQNYRQREPCPIGIFPGSSVFLSVNPSTEPPGAQYKNCHPQVLVFDAPNLNAPFKVLEPAWAEDAHFTDHSYRGFTVDAANRELLLLNINARTGKHYVSCCDASSRWHQKGTITFPIRACYPQVALCNRSAHVLAIGDIVEPIKEWQELKFKKTGSKWDYVFRRLFYTYTPNIAKTPFIEPIEIATVDSTGGHIMNLDMHVDAENAAHLLYVKEPYGNPHVHEAYFPDKPRTKHLEYAIVKAGKVISQRSLIDKVKDTDRLTPIWARFHVATGGELYVIVTGTLTAEDGKATPQNFIGRIEPGTNQPKLHRLAMKNPFTGAFFTATSRAGTHYSDIIDLMGTAGDPFTLRYARIRLNK